MTISCAAGMVGTTCAYKVHVMYTRACEIDAASPGVARIFQRGGGGGGQSEGAKWPSGGRVWEGPGVPPSTEGRFFVVENSCMKTAFSCTLMPLLGGNYVRWHINPLYIPLLKLSFTPIKGSMGPCAS